MRRYAFSVGECRQAREEQACQQNRQAENTTQHDPRFTFQLSIDGPLKHTFVHEYTGDWSQILQNGAQFDHNERSPPILPAPGIAGFSRSRRLGATSVSVLLRRARITDTRGDRTPGALPRSTASRKQFHRSPPLPDVAAPRRLHPALNATGKKPQVIHEKNKPQAIQISTTSWRECSLPGLCGDLPFVLQ
jgi:hypothetical protein